MLPKLAELQKKLKTIPFKKFLYESLKGHESELEDYNINQLQHGEDSTGRKITPRYANRGYAALKNAENPKPGFGTPDLRYTGGFYRGIKTTVNNRGVRTTGTDEKTPELQFKYGDEIIGINVSKSTIKEDFLLEEMREKVYNHFKK